jgi:hypothetical protein
MRKRESEALHQALAAIFADRLEVSSCCGLKRELSSASGITAPDDFRTISSGASSCLTGV